jgi:hypothetical protein
VARREIQERQIQLQSESIINIAPNGAGDLEDMHVQAGLWSQKLLGNTEFARQLGYNHSKIMNERNALNARYRRGFLISPVTPWRNSEIVAANVTTVLDLAQISITVVLLALDTNIGETYASTVPVAVPGTPAVRRLLSSTAGPRIRQVSRMMLQLNTADSSSIQPVVGEDISVARTTTREITSVNDNDNVVRAVCQAAGAKMGNMRAEQRQLTPEMYCLSENELINALQPVLTSERQMESRNAIAEVRITSISRPDFESVCIGANARRLLQNSGANGVALVNMVEVYNKIETLDQFIIVMAGLKRTQNEGMNVTSDVVTPCASLVTEADKTTCILAWISQNLQKRLVLEATITKNAFGDSYVFASPGPFSVCNTVDTEPQMDNCFKAYLDQLYLAINPNEEKPKFSIDTTTALALDKTQELFKTTVCDVYKSFWYLAPSICPFVVDKYDSPTTQKEIHVEMTMRTIRTVTDTQYINLRKETRKKLITAGFPLQETVVLVFTLDMAMTTFDATQKTKFIGHVAKAYGVESSKIVLKSIDEVMVPVRRRLLAAQLQVTVEVKVRVLADGSTPPSKQNAIEGNLMSDGFMSAVSADSSGTTEPMSSTTIIMISVGAGIGALVIGYIVYYLGFVRSPSDYKLADN